MAGVTKDTRTGNWLINFHYGKRRFLISSKTDNLKDATLFKSRIEETLQLLERGHLTMPADADPKVFISSAGKLAIKPKLDAIASKLGALCDQYIDDQHGKAPNSISCEKLHLSHFRRIWGETSKLNATGVKEIQEYVNARTKARFRGKPTSGRTIRKELVTFTQLWAWSKRRGFVRTPCPLYDENRKWVVDLAKPAEKEKFQTWEQIERRIKRGGLTDIEKADLWASLFLDNAQVVELLDYVQATAPHDFIHPMFVFAAYTGARRSEICRSEIEDVDFDSRRIKIREMKRRKDKSGSYRFVDLHPRLAEVLKDWFKKHPGGRYTIAAPLAIPRRKPRAAFSEMTPNEAHHHFRKTLKGSKWAKVRGFHVLRHSFGSNLARAGVPRDRIGDWMGHSTQEMMEHYQHLFPQDGASQIAALN